MWKIIAGEKNVFQIFYYPIRSHFAVGKDEQNLIQYRISVGMAFSKRWNVNYDLQFISSFEILHTNL